MSSQSFPMLVARRYLRPSSRNRVLSFITLVATIGVMLGTCALLISLSILQGFDQSLRTTIIDFMGHIELTPSPALGDSLASSFANAETFTENYSAIQSISPFVRREAIIRTSDGLEGVLLKGIDAKTDVSTVRSKIVQGSYVSEVSGTLEESLPELVIGERLSSKLNVGLGDTAVLFIAGERRGLDDAPMIEQFVIRGIYRSGMAQYDDIYIFSDIEAARNLLEYGPNVVSGYDLILSDPELISQTAFDINQNRSLPFEALPVFELFRNAFAWIDLQRMLIPIVMAIIAMVATFNVIATLLMTVLEKTKSIATFATIGARPSAIMRIFMLKGLMVTMVGLVLGTLLTLIFSVLQQQFGLIGLDAEIYFFEDVPIAIVPWHYIAVWGGTLVIALLTTLLPAAIASRLRPVVTLKFQ